MSIGATIQLRRGLDADLAAFTPADGEPLWTTDTHTLWVGQGGTAYLVSGTPSPLTTKGDVWTFSTADARLGVGTNGQILTADSTTATGLKWVTAGAGLASPLTTKGDLWAFTTTDARLGVGSDAWVLQADSTTASGLRWGVLASNSLADHVVSYVKMQQETGPAVIGRATNTPGDLGAITGTANQVLRVNSAGTTLAFGTVAEAGGGTNQTTYTLGDVLYASAANTLSKLAGNTTATRKFLRQTGTGSASAAPAWDTLASGDLPAGTGTVTSVGLALPAIFTVSGSPVAGAGTLTGALATQTANRVFAGPTTGAAAAPTFRALANGDVPGYGCLVTNSTTQSISNATWTSVTWDTETFDDAAFHSTATNPSRMTVPTGYDGLYAVTLTVEWASGTTGTRLARIFKNGTTVLAIAGGWVVGAGLNPSLVVAVVVRLAATDYVEGQAWQSNGGALNANPSGAGSFAIAYLGK